MNRPKKVNDMNRVLKAVVCGVVLSAGLFSCGVPPPADPCLGRLPGDLVISELMIDPDGTDTGAEWIEVYNSLGAPLEIKGFSVYVRDLDGTNLKTHIIKAGSVPSQSYFVMGDVRSGPNPSWVNYSYADGLGSMGNARGVVGIRCGTTVLDEVTYTRTAKSGRSRMLRGGTISPNSLENDNEQNWCDTSPGLVYLTPNAGTPGARNPVCMAEAMLGTCLENGVARPIFPPGEGDLVITEIMASPQASSDTTGEWFEVLARNDVDLNDITIKNASGSTDTVQSMNCLRVLSGEYALFARSADPFVNGALPSPTALYSVSLSSTNERLTLTRGDAGIDEAAVTASSSGKAWQLDPSKLDPLSNDDPANFCKAPLLWSTDGGGDYGSPAEANPNCAAVPDGGQMMDPNSCLDPISLAVRPVRRPAPGDLVISEWMADPAAVTDSAGEYFEVLANHDLDLNGVILGDSSATVTRLSSSKCLAVAANGFALFARTTNALANGKLPAPIATFSFDLNNTNETIRVLNPDGGVLDTVMYTTAKPGISTQLKPGLTSPADNDVATNLCPTPDAGGNRYGNPLPDGARKSRAAHRAGGGAHRLRRLEVWASDRRGDQRGRRRHLRARQRREDSALAGRRA
jgi:hypothetical protein